jgi:hypothetical protein
MANVIRKFFLVGMILFFLALSIRGQNTILYRNFNPTVDTCSDASSVIIYQIHPSFTPGTFKCTGGVYVAFDFNGGTSGPLSGSGTANFLAKWSAGTTLTDSILTDNGSDTVTAATNPAAFIFNIGNTATLFNVAGAAGAFRDVKARNFFVDAATPNSMCYVNGIKLLVCDPSPINGQILIGSTGLAPVVGNISSSAPITITNSPGFIGVNCPSCSRTLFSNSTAVGNITGGEDDLLTFTIPGGVMAPDNVSISFHASISFSTASETKILRAYLGGFNIFTGSMPSDATPLSIDLNCEIIRVNNVSQKSICSINPSIEGGLILSNTTIANPTVTLADPNVVKLTGEASTTNAIIANFWRGTLHGAP